MPGGDPAVDDLGLVLDPAPHLAAEIVVELRGAMQDLIGEDLGGIGLAAGGLDLGRDVIGEGGGGLGIGPDAVAAGKPGFEDVAPAPPR